MSETKRLMGYCPNCNRSLSYAQESQIVTCPCCDKEVTPMLKTANENSFDRNSPSTEAVMMGFDNPESAIVYLENYFENYDWSEYIKITEIVPYDIRSIIEKNKIKNGASGSSWFLAFKGTAYPLSKKLEGLSTLETEMAEKYDPVDNSEVLEIFDSYKKIVNVLIEKKDKLIKELESYVRYAEKFNLDGDSLEKIKGELEFVKNGLEALNKVEKASEVKAYKEAKAANDKVKAAEFASRGIDAAAIYSEAVSKYESEFGSNLEALMLFEKIRGYSDSAEYISKINAHFNFHNEFLTYFDRQFIFKEERFTLNLKDLLGSDKDGGKNKKGCALGKKKAAEEEQALEQEVDSAEAKLCLSLYRVVDGVPEEEPSVKGINEIIGYYSGRIYFFKEREGIAYYDFVSEQTTVIDEGKNDDYPKVNGRYAVYLNLNVDKNGFYFKKCLPTSTFSVTKKGGCLSKKKTEDIINNNNYSISYIDMRTNTLKTLVPECVDIADRYGDSLFYITAKVDAPEEEGGCLSVLKNFFKNLFKKKKEEEEEPEIETTLMLCDLATGECKKILDEACEIHNVKDGKVIYSVWAPNQYNTDLHVYDIATEEDTIIENNVYDYFHTLKGYIYYTVGGTGSYPLIRNNFEGTDRSEIMKNVKGIIGTRGKWIYVKKGTDYYNYAIEKVSADGKEHVFICSHFKSFVKFTENYIYYFDAFGALRSVRTDGKDEKLIISGQNHNTVVNDNAIYYLRNETVDDNRKANSLYTVDTDGIGVRKLVFDMDKIMHIDEQTLYYSRKLTLRFKVSVPLGKEKVDERYEYYNLTEYYEYDKISAQAKLILTLGLPQGKTSYKSGCLKKEVEADVVYEKAPLPRAYKRKGLAEAGDASSAASEKGDFEVILKSSGKSKLRVIAIVYKAAGVSLKQAKDLVESLPATVVKGATKEDAERLAEQLKSAGADVELR